MVGMKLAEALALRADAARRAEQLRARIAASARYQEGEAPAEDAGTLLTEAGEVLNELESLIRRINGTNAATLVEGGTLTDALARRDVLRLRHSVITSAADAAAGKDQRAFRQLRSELKMIPALPVAELRGQADGLARELREVDTLVQRTNWEADLLD
jgi:threonine aldolase